MLTLRLKKTADGSSALTFVRADGTTLARAFCGLVAEGWDFEDFSSPWRRGPLPAEAMRAEAIVGILDMDRAMAVHGAFEFGER